MSRRLARNSARRGRRAPARFSVKAPSRTELNALDVEDAMYAWAIAREWDGIGRLEQMARQRRQGPLGEIAAMRRAVLLTGVNSLLREDQPETIERAFEVALERANGWVVAGEARSERWTEHARRALTRRSRDLAALRDGCCPSSAAICHTEVHSLDCW